MEFPRHLHKPEGCYVVVAREDDLQPLLDRGWTLEPEGAVEQPVEVTMAAALSGEMVYAAPIIADAEPIPAESDFEPQAFEPDPNEPETLTERKKSKKK